MMTQAARSTPQSRRQPNEFVLAQVKETLWNHEPIRVSGSSIEVEVDDTTVRLFGRVRVLALKQVAGYLVRRVADGRQVENQLVSDSEIIQEVATALAREPLTRPYVIRVEARLGRVTLRGVVPSVEVEQRALEVAAAVPSVTSAISELETDPAIASLFAPKPSEAVQVEARPTVEVGSAD